MSNIKTNLSIDSYAAALTYIYSYTGYNPADTSDWSLDRLRRLLAQLDDLHWNFPSLLIAGTKGKGSTAAMCESIFRAAGYKTGLFISPYLHSFRESISIGGNLIAEDHLIALLKRYRPAFEATPGLTAFELTTVLALIAFAEAEIEAAVLEVGLGGRLDATNVVEPAVAVITSVSYDHTQILGDTLTQIAREKAGIIRPGARVVTAPQVDEVKRVLEDVCAKLGARLVRIEREWDWQLQSFDLDGQRFTVGNEAYFTPLLGEHQMVNAVTAMAAVKEFCAQTGSSIRNDAVKNGLAQVRWPGRLEIFKQRPNLVLDCAMNGDSMVQLVQALQQYFPNRKVTCIFGASHDHKVRDMLALLLPVVNRMIVTASAHKRAEQPENLEKIAAELGYQVTAIAGPTLALEQALTTAADDVICTTGSLFLVAEVREAWLRRTGRPLPPVDPQDIFTE